MNLLKAVPAPKTWWAKQITDELYTAGRLTESQFKNALEAGYRSVVSLYRYKDCTHIGTESVPSSERMRYLAGEVGLHYDTLHEVNQNWMTKDNVEAIAKKLDEAPRPIMLQCHDSSDSTLCMLLYLALRSTNATDGSSSSRIDEIFRHLHQQGFSCTNPDWLKLISAVTGENAAVSPLQPDITVPDWYKKYWLARPVYKNVYITGQIRPNYFPHIRALGFKYICNLRFGQQTQGQPSQEEVTLQNVRCFTGTYVKGGRQSDDRLLRTRVYPDVSNSYILEKSCLNYEASNPLEFGDDIGFNETMMRKDIEKGLPGIQYIHTPLEPMDAFTADTTWGLYKDIWSSISADENVLFSCMIGFRSVVAALLMLGHRYKLPGEWAIRRAQELGYHFPDIARDDVNELFAKLLGPPTVSSNI